MRSLSDTLLSGARIGDRGRIVGLAAGEVAGAGVSAEELEKRLLEIGFVEGAAFEVLHVGLIGGDPLAVRLNDTRIALRRREARAVLIARDLISHPADEA